MKPHNNMLTPGEMSELTDALEKLSKPLGNATTTSGSTASSSGFVHSGSTGLAGGGGAGNGVVTLGPNTASQHPHYWNNQPNTGTTWTSTSTSGGPHYHRGVISLSAIAVSIDGGMVVLPADIQLVITKDGSESGERMTLMDLLEKANIRCVFLPSSNNLYIKSEVWDAIVLLQSMIDAGSTHIDSIIFLRNTVAGMAEAK